MRPNGSDFCHLLRAVQPPGVEFLGGRRLMAEEAKKREREIKKVRRV